MFKISAFVVAVCLAMGVQAKERQISVIYSSPAGGIIDGHNKAMQEQLEKNNWRVDAVRAPNCRAAKAWLDSNPGKAAVMNFQVEEDAYTRMAPGAADACGMTIDPKNVAAISLANHYVVCSMLPPEKALPKFLAGGNKIGVTFFASTNAVVAESLVKTLNLKDTKVLRFQGQPKNTQALVSGDVDFTIGTNASSITSAGGQCFLSTAPKAAAEKMGWKSIADLDPKNPWIGSGQMYVYLAFNTDPRGIAKETVEVIKTNPVLIDYNKTNSYPTGIAAGQTVDQQWKTIDNHIKRYLAK
jgi:hypothetical protein